MTATWRATQKAHRRAALMESAARLFAEGDFAAVSTAELGEAVGMSGPALYKHFPSKDALLAEIHVDASERLLDGCRTILADGSPEEARGGAADTLMRLIRFHPEFATTDPDVIRMQDRELPSLTPEDNQEVRRLQRVQLSDGAPARLDPAMRDDERQVRLLGAFGLLNSTPHSAPDSTGDPAGLILAGMAYRSLAGGTSPAVAADAGSAA